MCEACVIESDIRLQAAENDTPRQNRFAAFCVVISPRFLLPVNRR